MCNSEIKKLKPFNLERALTGDPVVTRDGREVIRIAYFPEAEEGNRVIFLVKGTDEAMDCFTNGRSFENQESCYDLFMAEKTNHENFSKNSLKPFDLKRALAGDEVICKSDYDGYSFISKVLQIAYFPYIESRWNIYVQVEGLGYVYIVDEKGEFKISGKKLYMEPKKKRLWL